jgi:hypothetical protein
MPDGSPVPHAPSLDIAKQFWTLYAGAEAPIRIALLPAVSWPQELKNQKKFSPYSAIEVEGALDQLWSLIVHKQAEGYACYFFANATLPSFTGHAKDKDIATIRSFHIDADQGLPTEWHIEPSLVVRTSLVIGEDGQQIQKGAAFWHARPETTPDEFPQVQAALIAHYGSDKQVKDLKRIMRLPGSIHRKPAIPGDEIRTRLVASPTKETVDAIPLTAPQLVTFEDRGAHDQIPAEWHLTLLTPDKPAVEQAVRDPTSQPAPSIEYPSEPQAKEAVYAVLTKNNPFCDRDGWAKTVQALPSIPLIGEEQDPEGFLREKRELAHAFERGALFYRAPTLPELKHLSGLYRGAGEVDRVFDWAINAGRECGGMGALINRAREEDPSFNVAAAISSAEFLQQLGQGGGIKLRDEDYIEALPDIEELIEGVLSTGEDAAIVAEPKTSKTFTALDIALSIAYNLPMLGHFPVKHTGPVVYLSGEGHRGMKKRLRAWRRARGVGTPGRNFYYVADVPKTEKGLAEANLYLAATRARVQGVMLVVIDTASRSLAGLNENETASWNLYADMVAALRLGLGQNTSTLSLIHASNKPSAQKLRDQPDIRGSSGASAVFDSVFTLDEDKATQTIEWASKWLKDVDTEDRPPFWFRLQKDPKAKSATLVLTDKPKTRTQGAADLRATMVRHGMVGYENAKTDDEFVKLLTGPEPRPDPKLPDAKNAEALSKWQSNHDRNVEMLEKGARRKGETRPAPFDGLFDYGNPPVPTLKQVKTQLRGFNTGEQPRADGRAKKKTVRLWYIPEKEQEQEA